jgi:hypothetical protein
MPLCGSGGDVVPSLLLFPAILMAGSGAGFPLISTPDAGPIFRVHVKISSSKTFSFTHNPGGSGAVFAKEIRKHRPKRGTFQSSPTCIELPLWKQQQNG